MNQNFNDISHIESYFKDKMEAADRQAFEAQLRQDEELQQEVAAYRKLFDGFQGLKEEAFAKEVGNWMEAARAKSGETTSTARVVPIQRSARTQNMWRRLAVAASFILLAGMAAAWWASKQYTNAHMVQNAYSPPLSSGTMGGPAQQASDLEKAFELGHQFFQKGNYTDAAQQFDAVVTSLQTNPELFDDITRKFYLENAKWTRLLAQFAAGQLTDQQISTELDTFAADPGSDYAEKAKSLKKDLRSIWRKMGR